MTQADVDAHNARVARVVPAASTSPDDAVEREDTLHRQIMDYCGRQWPKWKYRHARMDRKTTEEVGVEDFTIFADKGRTFHFECKARGKKRTTDQLVWAMQMIHLKHEVHLIESFSQFIGIVNA